MLKLCGCVCILAASSGMAYSCILTLYRRLQQTELLSELVTAMEGELTYSRCPLPELLERLSRHISQPYGRKTGSGYSIAVGGSLRAVPQADEPAAGSIRGAA